jgi:hypothetical protein
VLACAAPFEDETLVWPPLPDGLLLELLVDVPELSSPDSLSPELVVAVVDELSALLVVDVARADCVVSRAARPKPAVAATAVTARPAVSAVARRLPCSRDVMVASFDGVP